MVCIVAKVLENYLFTIDDVSLALLSGQYAATLEVEDLSLLNAHCSVVEGDNARDCSVDADGEAARTCCGVGYAECCAIAVERTGGGFYELAVAVAVVSLSSI